MAPVDLCGKRVVRSQTMDGARYEYVPDSFQADASRDSVEEEGGTGGCGKPKSPAKTDLLSTEYHSIGVKRYSHRRRLLPEMEL